MSDNKSSSNELAFFWSLCDIGFMHSFTEKDLNEPSKVKWIFGALMEHESGADTICYITSKGWHYLINHYGYETLLAIDQKIGWHNSASIEEYKDLLNSLIVDD